MIAIDETLFSGGIEPLLYGPDLTTAPSLAAQLAALDRVQAEGDVDAYVITWLGISDTNGGWPQAFWDTRDAPDAPAAIMTGIQCDAQERERTVRRAALHEHHQHLPDFHHAMERELLRLGRYSDNRRAPLLEVKAVVRAFLATGGRLMIPPASDRRHRWPVEPAPATDRFLKNDWSYADQIAARAMVRLCHRWRAHKRLERIVRMLGKRTDHNWIILEGEGA